MKMNMDIPVNIGDKFYYIVNPGATNQMLCDFEDISESEVYGFIILKDGIFIIDDIGDRFGRVDKMNCPISETEFIADYTTKENAKKAIAEWNKHVEDKD